MVIASCAVGLVVTRLVALSVHEGAHALAAHILGYHATVKLSLWGKSSTHVAGLASVRSWEAELIRHAGWVFSVVMAIGACLLRVSWTNLAVVALTAFDGIYSDLLGGGDYQVCCTFFCGNFGVLVLDKAALPLVKRVIETMIRVTMMRGAQSAGLVTYVRQGKHITGVRRRVVNGKRTDLCNLLIGKCGPLLKPSAMTTPQIFQGMRCCLYSFAPAMPARRRVVSIRM